MAGGIITIRAVDVRQHTSFRHLLGRGRVFVGLKMLFDSQGNPFTIANHYIQDEARQTARDHKDWRKTADARADDLVQFFTAAEALSIDWPQCTGDDLEEIISLMAARISPINRKSSEPATLKRRRSTINSYYRYAKQVGSLAPGAFDGTHSLRGKLWTSEYDFSFLPGSRNSEKLHPMRLTDAKAALDNLAPDGDENYPQRDRLGAETSFLTGMRDCEVCGLTINQIYWLDQKTRHLENPYAVYALPLKKTKGMYPRSVLFPVFLIRKLLKYVDGERRATLVRAREIGKFPAGRPEPSALFLNSLKANHRDIGEPCTPSTMSRAFTEAVISLGLVSEEERCVLDGDGREIRVGDGYLTEVICVPAHTFHDLRHTFAVQVYYQGKAVGEKEPWKRVQTLLGHRSILTTLNTYLNWANVEEPEISDMFTVMLRRMDDALLVA